MVLIMIVLAQVFVAAVIVVVLWALLKRELLTAALQALLQASPQGDIEEVSVVTAALLSSADEQKLRVVLEGRFAAASVNFIVNPEIRGGLLIQAGDLVLDYCLLTRIKHFFGQKDA